MKKSTSYYSKGFKRKMIAQAFHKGFLANKAQKKVISDLLGKHDDSITVCYQKEYKALKYLDEDYKNNLQFENDIAVAEKDGSQNPLTPGLYALYLYNLDKMDLFDEHISYLQSIMNREGEYCFWNYETGVERFNIEGPWVSGISQGIIASAFIRKYFESKDDLYLKIAKGAIGYCLDEKNGLRTETDGGFWIEEYPSGIGKGVLNGFIFFLIGLGELASCGFYVEEFKMGISSLIKQLPNFHKGDYILYGLNIPDLGNPLYDKIHFHQLEALYKLTSLSGFYSLKDYWRKTSVTQF